MALYFQHLDITILREFELEVEVEHILVIMTHGGLRHSRPMALEIKNLNMDFKERLF